MRLRCGSSLARWSLVALLAALLILPATTVGAVVTQVQKITPSDGGANDGFGYAVAVSPDGGTAVIGAYRKNTSAGAIYIYTKAVGGTWLLKQEITSVTPAGGIDALAANDDFGFAVAIDNTGTTILVGAPAINSAVRGKAYVFITADHTTWSVQEELKPTGIGESDQFGFSVALSGAATTALVGAHARSTAYVFAGSPLNTTPVNILAGSAGTDFGWSVALNQSATPAVDGTTAIVGAISDQSGTGGGAAYVYTGGPPFTGAAQKLQPSVSGAAFGNAVALSGDGNTALVGAPYDNSATPTNPSGAAFAYFKSGGAFGTATAQRINPTDTVPPDFTGGYFGSTVALSGDGGVAAVGETEGATTLANPTTNPGSVSVYRKSGATFDTANKQTLFASDPAGQDFFGSGLGLARDGIGLLVGAQDVHPPTGPGAAYAFTTSPDLTPAAGALPDGTVGTAYSQQFTATNGAGGPYMYAVTVGTLPPGLNLMTSGANAGQLTGTPTTVGPYSFSIKATDAGGGTVTQAYTLQINPGTGVLTITPPTLPNGAVGTAYSRQLTASGGSGTGYTFAVTTGALPTGLTLTAAGLLAGTPTTPSSPTFTVIATDSVGNTGTIQYTLTIAAGSGILTIAPPTLPNGTVGTAYSQQLTATGGSGTGYTFAVTTGTLPAGLTLTAAGLLAGTPTTPGAPTFTVTAKDSAGATGTRQYTLTITAAGPPPAAGLQYYALPTPVRLLDTRPGAIAFVHPNAPLTAGQSLTLPGQFSYLGVTIPATAQAIVGNATVDNAGGAPAAAGFATVHPDRSAPTTSNLNFLPGTVRANAFTATLAGDGTFTLFSSTGGNFVIDIVGYYAPVGAGGLYFHPLAAPVRELDTRSGNSAFVHPNATLTAGQTVNLAGRFSYAGQTIPASAQALVGNLTVADDKNGTGAGYATVYPHGVALPLASTVNYVAGTVAPNAFTVGVGGDGTYNLYTSSGGDFVVDITGYFDTVAAGGLLYTPLSAPVRELDTRSGATALVHPNATLTAGQTLSLPGTFTFAGITVPVGAKALVGNATVANDGNGTPAGFATVYPDDVTLPLASNLNFVAKQVAPNAITVGIGAGGGYKLYSSTGGDFVIDITGYFS